MRGVRVARDWHASSNKPRAEGRGNWSHMIWVNNSQNENGEREEDDEEWMNEEGEWSKIESKAVFHFFFFSFFFYNFFVVGVCVWKKRTVRVWGEAQFCTTVTA